MHPPPAFRRKRDIVRRIIHLSLHSRSRLEPLHRRFRSVRPYRAQMLFHDAVAALETQSAKLFMQTDSGEIRVAFQKFFEERAKLLPWIEEYSPITHVSKDDPPIYMNYPRQKSPPSAGQKEPDPTHSAMYGVKLAERLKSAGVEVVLTYPGSKDSKYGSPTKFLIDKLNVD